MTSPSPSEFLTFMRYAAVRSSMRPSTISLAGPSRQPLYSSAATQSRRLSTSTPYHASSQPKTANQSKEHVLDRQDKLDVQSDASQSGKQARAKGGVDTATAQSDARKSAERAKKEHPEAPDTVLGMQDERGKRGL